MKKQMFLVLAFVTLLFSAFAYADELRANVPFNFAAGDKILPAGDYRFVWDNKMPTVVTVLDSAGKAEKQLIIIGRLPERSDPSGTRGTVFDKVGDQRLLSEIWFSSHDGFLVGAVEGKHTHEVVRQ